MWMSPNWDANFGVVAHFMRSFELEGQEAISQPGRVVGEEDDKGKIRY
jgi:hypothetical protein